MCVLAAQGCIVAAEERSAPPRTPIARATRAVDEAPVGSPTTGRVDTPSAPGVSSPVATISSPRTPTVSAVGIRPAEEATGRYVVRPGDTLSGLSRRFGVPAAELAQANGIAPDALLRTGQVLALPNGMWSSELRIRVTRPLAGTSVRAPVVVEGTAATFESMIVAELIDPAVPGPLARASTRAQGVDIGAHGPFRVELPVAIAGSARAVTVRVYWTSPRDGAPLDEVRVPITIVSGSGVQ